MSGYDKSPDYGGPEPTKKGFVLFVLIALALAFVLFFAFSSEAETL